MEILRSKIWEANLVYLSSAFNFRWKPVYENPVIAERILAGHLSQKQKQKKNEGKKIIARSFCEGMLFRTNTISQTVLYEWTESPEQSEPRMKGWGVTENGAPRRGVCKKWGMDRKREGLPPGSPSAPFSQRKRNGVRIATRRAGERGGWSESPLQWICIYWVRLNRRLNRPVSPQDREKY